MRTLFIDSIGLVLKRMCSAYAGSSFAWLRSYSKIFKKLNAPGKCRSPSPEDAPQEPADARTIAQDMVFLGKELTQSPNYSDAVPERIDAEIEGFLCKAWETATVSLRPTGQS